MDEFDKKVKDLTNKQDELRKLLHNTYEDFKSLVDEIKSKHQYIYKQGYKRINGKPGRGEIKKYETKYLCVHYPDLQLYIPVGKPLHYPEAKVVFNPDLYKKNWAFNKEDIQ